MTRTARIAIPPLLLAALLLSCAKKEEAVDRAVLFLPEKPSPEERITVAYRPDLSSSPLRSETPLFRFTLLARDGRSAAAEIPLERRGEAWEGSFVPSEILPENPVLLAGAFVDAGDPEVVDNNRANPWILLFHDGETPVPGARYQFQRLLSGGKRLNDPLHVPRNRQMAREVLALAAEERPGAAEARLARWAEVLSAEEPDPGRADSLLAAARAEADIFFMDQENWTEPPPGTREALDLAGALGGDALRDSLTDALLARFPRTRFASAVLFDRVLREKDRALLARNLAAFARELSETEEAEQARTYAAHLFLRSLGDRESARAVIEEGGAVERYALGLYAETLLEEGGNAEEAEKVLLRAIREEEESVRPVHGERSPAEWERDRRETLASLLSLLARAREARGDDAGAAEALVRALRDFPGETSEEALLRAARVLARTGDAEGALEAFERLARAGGPPEEASREWRALWEENREGDFDARVARLREEGRAETMARLDRRALRWPVPEIRFLGAAGDTLGLADFRGRPVLIDFWATWCGPCRRALPHLQMVHDQSYEAGDDLVVLPINVWERSAGEERRETVRGGWEELGLTMPYYLDLDPGEGGETAANLFGVPAIPTTCLVGRDGALLFKIVGFDEERGEEEMRLMIDYALAR